VQRCCCVMILYWKSILHYSHVILPCLIPCYHRRYHQHYYRQQKHYVVSIVPCIYPHDDSLIVPCVGYSIPIVVRVYALLVAVVVVVDIADVLVASLFVFLGLVLLLLLCSAVVVPEGRRGVLILLLLMG